MRTRNPVIYISKKTPTLTRDSNPQLYPVKLEDQVIILTPDKTSSRKFYTSPKIFMNLHQNFTQETRECFLYNFRSGLTGDGPLQLGAAIARGRYIDLYGYGQGQRQGQGQGYGQGQGQGQAQRSSYSVPQLWRPLDWEPGMNGLIYLAEDQLTHVKPTAF